MCSAMLFQVQTVSNFQNSLLCQTTCLKGKHKPQFVPQPIAKLHNALCVNITEVQGDVST